MTSRTLILGGGFGGLATATELRRRLGPEHEIVLVDRRDSFFMGLRKLWLLAGLGTVDEGRRALAALAPRGIRVVRGEITRIDPGSRRVETDAGALEGDFLVIALGAEPRADLVPGLSEAHGAFDLYQVESVAAAAHEVAALAGGRVAVIIAGVPYKCPPAPFECAMLLHEHFRSRGVRERVELTVTTLQPILLPNAGPEGSRWLGEELTRRDIDWRVGRKIHRFEAGRVLFEGGQDPLEFDLALVAPPHRPPRVVEESGLTEEGAWIAVDQGTLATRYPGVWAIGDVTQIPLANQLALPKAGLFAEAQGSRVAAGIEAQITRAAEPAPFDGRGYCFLEMGGGQAARIEGNFFARPEPDVQVGEPGAEQLAAKRRFESERLERWFGEPPVSPHRS